MITTFALRDACGAPTMAFCQIKSADRNWIPSCVGNALRFRIVRTPDDVTAQSAQNSKSTRRLCMRVSETSSMAWKKQLCSISSRIKMFPTQGNPTQGPAAPDAKVYVT